MIIKPTIGLIGAFQNGKSTLVNCLFGRQLAKVGGQGLSVTSINTRYTFGNKNEVEFIRSGEPIKTISLEEYLSDNAEIPASTSEIVIHYQDNLLENLDLIDTPGFNANKSDSIMAENALNDIDIAILVLRNKGISQYEYNITKKLSNHHIPFFVLINAYDEGEDLWYPNSKKNLDISKCIWNDLSTAGLRPIAFGKIGKVLVVNLIWYWLSIIPINENRSIRISQKKLKFFWEDYFEQDVTSRSLFFKSNFNKLFYKMTSDEFLRCALVAKIRKKQSNRLYKIIEYFGCDWINV